MSQSSVDNYTNRKTLHSLQRMDPTRLPITTTLSGSKWRNQECKLPDCCQQVAQHSCNRMPESLSEPAKCSSFSLDRLPFYQRIDHPSSALVPVMTRTETPPPLSSLSTELSRIDFNVDSKSPTNLGELPGASLEENWQISKKNVRERSSAVFLNDLMSDVHFVVGSKGGDEKPLRVPAHKFMLATASPVFYAMFYGSLAEQKNEIEIPDVEPSAFVAMLRYIYCDHVQFEPELVLSVLYCTKKYHIPHLSKICVKYLKSTLTAQNACLLLSQSRLFDETGLMHRCFEVIDAQAELALASEGFTQIDYETLRCILSRETLNAKEITIFECALQWANAECKRRKLDFCPDNLRTILGDVLFSVRIPAMNLEEFANGPAQSAILTVKEINDIFLHYTASNKPNLKFEIKPRLGLMLHKCHRFLSSAYRSNQWRYRGRCDSIQFCVDKRIFVVGFGLYGSSNGAAEYKVKIELKQLDRVLSSNLTSFASDGSSQTFHVFLPTPFPVEAEGVFYTASVVLDGTELSYFGQDGLSEVSLECGVNFQFQCSAESTNGTGVQGGQIPEILFYLPT